MKYKIECPICKDEKSLNKELHVGYMCEGCESVVGTVIHGDPAKACNFYPIESVKSYKIAKNSKRLFLLYENKVYVIKE